jgi:hypothetical protein
LSFNDPFLFYDTSCSHGRLYLIGVLDVSGVAVLFVDILNFRRSSRYSGFCSVTAAPPISCHIKCLPVDVFLRPLIIFESSL